MQPLPNLRALSADAALLLLYRSQKVSLDSGTGRVHSVFERAINIEDARGQLVTIASRDVDDAPDTIIVDIDRFSALGAQAGSTAHPTKDAIAVGERFTVRLDTAIAWDATLPTWPADDGPLRSNLETVRCEMARSVAAGTSPLATAMSSMIEERAGALCAALERRDAAAARACGQAMLGLGPGLTPSGDDFLVGLFAVLHLPGSPFEASSGICADIVADAAVRTNAVSVAALTAAARGRVRASIIGLLRALVAGNREAATTALRRVLAIGSTSGSDIAAGIVAGLGLQLTDRRTWKPQPTCHAA